MKKAAVPTSPPKPKAKAKKKVSKKKATNRDLAPKPQLWDIEANCIEITGHKVWVGSQNVITARSTLGESTERVYSGNSDAQVWCLLAVGGDVWAGFSDSYLRVFDQETFALRKELSQHSGGVQCLASNDEYVFSGSNDCLICQWSQSSKDGIKTYSGHSSSVRTVIADKDTLISGADDATILFWNISNGAKLGSLIGHEAPVRSLARTYKNVWSASEDSTLRVWDMSNGQCINVFKAGNVTGLVCVGDEIWSASKEGIRIWNEEGEIGALEAPSHSIRSTAWTFNYKIVSAGNDGVKIWDIPVDATKLQFLDKVSLSTKTSNSEMQPRWAHSPLRSPNNSSEAWIEKVRELQEAVDRLQQELTEKDSIISAAQSRTSELENETRKTRSQSPPAPDPKIATLEAEIRKMTTSHREDLQRINELEHKLDNVSKLSEETISKIMSGQNVSPVLAARWVEHLGLRQTLSELKQKNLRLVAEKDNLQLELEKSGLEVKHKDNVIEQLKKSRNNNELSNTEWTAKFQEVLASKKELENNLKQRDQQLLAKNDELQDVTALICQRDNTIASLRSIVDTLQQENRNLQEKLQQTHLQQENLQQQQAIPVAERVVEVDNLEQKRREFLEAEITTLKAKVLDLEHWKACNRPAPGPQREFIYKTRNLFVRAIHQLTDSIYQADKASTPATDLLRNMIFALHTREELRDNIEDIQRKYSDIFQVLDLVKMAHHQSRQILTDYLMDVERLTLGLPVKGFDVEVTQEEIQKVEEEMNHINMQYNQPDHESQRPTSIELSDVEAVSDEEEEQVWL